MKRNAGKIGVSFFLVLCLIVPALSTVLGGEFKALEGLKSVKTIFDFRDGNPDSALIHLQLVHDTYKDKAIREVDGAPEFAVVFMGGSVKLLSKNRDGFSAQEKKGLAELDRVVSAMVKDGIRLEICMFAAHFFGVDPKSVSPEIHRVPNGWISSLGYQAKGYGLIPVF